MKSTASRLFRYNARILAVNMLMALMIAVIWAVFSGLLFSGMSISKNYIIPMLFIALMGAMAGLQRYSFLQYSVGYCVTRKNMFLSGLVSSFAFTVLVSGLFWVYTALVSNYAGYDIRLNYLIFPPAILALCAFGDLLGLLIGTRTKTGTVLYFVFFVLFVMVIAIVSGFLAAAPELLEKIGPIIRSPIAAAVLAAVFAVTTAVNLKLLYHNEVKN